MLSLYREKRLIYYFMANYKLPSKHRVYLMSLPTTTMAHLIRDSEDDCDIVDDLEFPNYSQAWTTKPKQTYVNRRQRCRRLITLWQTSNPVWRGDYGLGKYMHRFMEPQYKTHETFHSSHSMGWILLMAIMLLLWFRYGV